MRVPQRKSVRSLSGWVLLEVMIAVSLSLLVITALTRVYLTMHQVFREQQQRQSQQQIAQKVMALLTDEITSAGHIGCARLRDDFRLYPYLTQTLTISNALEVNDDTLTVRYQAFPGVELLKDSLTTGSLVAEAAEHFTQGALLLISDCQHAEIFQVQSIRKSGSEQIIIPAMALHFNYHQGAEIGRLIVRHYQVENMHGGSCLTRRDGNGAKVIVAAGVGGLQFTLDQRGAAYQFFTASQGVQDNWYGYVSFNR